MRCWRAKLFRSFVTHGRSQRPLLYVASQHPTNTMTFCAISDRTTWGLTLARWGVVGMAASMPISRAVFNLSASLMIIGWLLSGRWREKFNVIRSDRAAMACIALFALGALSLILGGPAHDRSLEPIAGL